MAGWTQPLCADCFAIDYPGREPVRVRDDDEMRCCECGRATSAGIYVRRDPATVRYPREPETG